MSTKKPEALRLADELDNGDFYESQPQCVYGWAGEDPCSDAAAELRRQHALIGELVEALKGVQTAIYMDKDDGRLRLLRSFDDSVIYDAIEKAAGEQP